MLNEGRSAIYSPETMAILRDLGDLKGDIGELDGKTELIISEMGAINARVASHDRRIQMVERVVFGVLLVVTLLGVTGFLPGV